MKSSCHSRCLEWTARELFVSYEIRLSSIVGGSESLRGDIGG